MRKANWQKSFWEAVERERAGSFVWGERDCVLVAARVCDSVLEEPRLEESVKLFGVWTNAREAAKVFQGVELEVDISNYLEKISKYRLGQGDLVLCSYDDPDKVFNQTLAFHDGTTPITPGDKKLVSVNPSLIICGWRVE